MVDVDESDRGRVAGLTFVDWTQDSVKSGGVHEGEDEAGIENCLGDGH